MLYQKIENKPIVSEIYFNPAFKDQLYFVYLNKKQNSRDGIAMYRNYTGNVSKSTLDINTITKNLIDCESLEAFKHLITTHESIISKIIKQDPIKNVLFNDFDGAIKSLGAWGGDFILAASELNPKDYFAQKGFTTIIPFSELI